MQPRFERDGVCVGLGTRLLFTGSQYIRGSWRQKFVSLSPPLIHARAHLRVVLMRETFTGGGGGVCVREAHVESFRRRD